MFPWYGYAIISALTIAAVGLLQKKTLQREHSLEYATVFTLFKLALFLAIFGPNVQWSVSGDLIWWVVIGGVVYAFAFLFIAKSMRRLDLSTVMPVLSIEPAIVAIIALGVLGEALTGGQWIGLGLTLIGTYVLEVRRHSEQPNQLFQPFLQLVRDRGGRLALWGLAFFSISSVIDRFALQRLDVLTYIGYILIISLAVYSLMWLASNEKSELFRSGQRWLIPVILLIAALHLTSNLTQAKAISLAAVGLVIAIKRTAALLDILIGGRMFHEQRLVQKTLASIIILIGVYFIVQT